MHKGCQSPAVLSSLDRVQGKLYVHELGLIKQHTFHWHVFHLTCFMKLI